MNSCLFLPGDPTGGDATLPPRPGEMTHSRAAQEPMAERAEERAVEDATSEAASG